MTISQQIYKYIINIQVSNYLIYNMQEIIPVINAENIVVINRLKTLIMR